jgi:hypothetical protein
MVYLHAHMHASMQVGVLKKGLTGVVRSFKFVRAAAYLLRHYQHGVPACMQVGVL